MKLEAGKMYVTRGGKVVGPMREADNGGAKFADENVGLYFEDGTFGYGDECRCMEYDIVAEYNVTPITAKIEPLSADAFRRIIEALNGAVDAALDNGDYEDAYGYAVMMQEVERVAMPTPPNAT